MELLCYTRIPANSPGKRIGIVKWYETGYYLTDYDTKTNTNEDAQAHVDLLNERLGISKEVAQSAADGSMFGWHVPAAQKAIEFFKAESLKAKKGDCDGTEDWNLRAAKEAR